MKTRAALLLEMGRPRPYAKSAPIVVEELDLEGPAPGEVLLEIAAAGLCHSDLSVINGSRPRPMPMVLGHEAAAVVREVGEGVVGFKPGDHVVLSYVPGGRRCAGSAWRLIERERCFRVRVGSSATGFR